MKIYDKIFPKIFGKLWDPLAGPPYASGGAPCTSDLLAWYKGGVYAGTDYSYTTDVRGTTDIDGDVLKAQSFAFDGSTYIVLPSTVTLSGDFEITASGIVSDLTSDQRCIIGNGASSNNQIRIMDGTGLFRVNIAGTDYDFNSLTATVGTVYTFTVTRSGSTLTGNLDGTTQDLSCNTSDMSLTWIGSRESGIDKYIGNLWDLSITDSSGNVVLYCPCTNAVGTDVPMQINGLLDYGTLTGATLPDFYASHQDGLTGFNPNVLGYSARENLLTYSEDFDNAVWHVTATGSGSGTVISLPAEGDKIYDDGVKASDGTVANKTFTLKCTAIGNGTANLQLSNNVDLQVNETFTFGSTPTEYTVTLENNGSGTVVAAIFRRQAGETATSITVTDLRIFEGTDDPGYAKTEGATISGIQPADPSTPSLDILGNTLQYPKPKLNAEYTGYAGTWDGTAYLANANLDGTETVTVSNGTSTPSVSAGKIDFTAGWCSDLTLSNGDRIIIESASDSEQTLFYSVTTSEVYTLTSATTPFCTTASTDATYLLENGWTEGEPDGVELITNGGLDTDSDWTKGTGWTIADGVATKVGGVSSQFRQDGVMTVGKTYQFSFDIPTRTAGSVSIFGVSYDTAGSYTVEETPSVTGNIVFVGDTTFAGTLDNISVQEIPTGYVPAKAGEIEWTDSENLLKYSEEFEQTSAWTVTNGTITENQETAPDSTLSGDLILRTSTNGRVAQAWTVDTTEGLTFEIVVKAGTTSTFGFYAYNADEAGYVIEETGLTISDGVSLGNGWYRHTASCTTADGPGYASGDTINFGIWAGPTNGLNMYIWGAHVYRTFIGSDYVKTTSSSVQATSSLVSVAPQSALGQNLTAKGTELRSFEPGYLEFPQDKGLLNADIVGQYGVDLVTNGTFDTDTDWTKGTGWTIGSGVASHAAGSLGVLEQSGVFAGTPTLQVSCDIVRTAGTLYARAGGNTNQKTIVASGSYTFEMTSEGLDTKVKFVADSLFVGTVDNVTVQELQDPINFFFDPDGDQRQITYSSLLPTYGDEEISNGGFDSDTVWTKGTNATISGGVLTYAGGSGNTDTYQTTTSTLPDNIYQVSFEITSYTSGTAKVRFGNDTSNGTNRSAVGSYTEVLTADSAATASFVVDVSADFVGSIDNVSVKEITATGANVNDQYFVVDDADGNPKELLVYAAPIGDSCLEETEEYQGA